MAVLMQTIPFFAIIALGFGAARAGAFPPEATAWLTRFVFYFALSAMLLRFSATLGLKEVWSAPFVGAYLSATGLVWALARGAARARGVEPRAAAMEAQCAVVGNVGFLGIPMLALLLGPAAIGPVMLVLATDLIVFGTLIVVAVTGTGAGAALPALRAAALGLARNPMIVSIAAGLAFAASGLPMPAPALAFLELLGGAATPGALFAIGASLAVLKAERFAVPAWLALAKLVLHPAAVALSALLVFDVEPYAASVMIAAAALPVAGNVYMIAAHYGVAPGRVSAAILISTALSVVTVTAVIALLAARTAGG